MSGGSFPPSGPFYAGAQQPYYHQNGLNDLQGGQDYGKQSGMSKQGQIGGNIYGQRSDSHNEKQQEHASSGRGFPSPSVYNGPVTSNTLNSSPSTLQSVQQNAAPPNKATFPAVSMAAALQMPQSIDKGYQPVSAPQPQSQLSPPTRMTMAENQTSPTISAPRGLSNSSPSSADSVSRQQLNQRPSPSQSPFHHKNLLFHPPSTPAQLNSNFSPHQVTPPTSSQMPQLPVSNAPLTPHTVSPRQQPSPHSSPSPSTGLSPKDQRVSALQSGKPKRPIPSQGSITPPVSGTPTPSRSPAPFDPTSASKSSTTGTPPPLVQGQVYHSRGGPLSTGRRAYPKQTNPPAIPVQPPMPGQPPLPGQTPMQGQSPMQGQPPVLGQPPMPGQPPLPGQTSVLGQTPMPGQPPMPRGFQPQPGVQPISQQQQPVAPGGPGRTYGSPSTGLEGAMGKLTVMGGSLPTGIHPVNLMEQRHILPTIPVELVTPPLPSDVQKRNCDSSVLCCTLNAIPETKSLLSKSKLPLGIHIHPFKDLQSLPVIHSSVITRCRSCRTYINPFVTFTDARRWRCSMCFRINDVPEEFCYDPSSRTYGDPNRRPEIKSATVEFIAPSEYMLRPPQPSVFLFALDVCFNAIDTGYLHGTCQLIKDNLDKLPGDARTQIGFITFDSTIHFYNLKSSLSQPQMFIVSELDDVFLPSPDDLMVNLKESKELVIQLLDSLPDMFKSTRNIHSATGSALQAALKLVGPTGGRITLFQTTLPSVGPGELKRREEPNQRASPKDVQNLTPATDFYKKFALDCAAEQVAVDMFVLASQYADLATLMCASKYSGGCVSYYPHFHAARNPAAVEKFENEFVRYLTRKIGFEAVMRVRATKGLSIHTFHGNFFVRSTDLVSLPNVNPDSAFSMQIDIEDSLCDSNLVSFQSALLYTSSKGERRIRVHTLALPVTNKLQDVYANADPQAIATLLSKMAVDRTLSSSLGDAREALMNASIDCLNVFRSQVANMGQSGQLLAPYSLKLLPLFILALLKHVAFRLGAGSKLDERCYAMQMLKVMPLSLAMLDIYPRMYPIHDISDENAIQSKAGVVGQPPIYHLSGEKLSRVGIFLMDTGHAFYVWIGKDTPSEILQQVFNVPTFSSIPENLASFPELENTLSERIRNFVDYLQSQRTCHAAIHIIREDSRQRPLFLQHLVDDRSESVMSYYEFLVHLQRQINN